MCLATLDALSLSVSALAVCKRTTDFDSDTHTLSLPLNRHLIQITCVFASKISPSLLLPCCLPLSDVEGITLSRLLTVIRQLVSSLHAPLHCSPASPPSLERRVSLLALLPPDSRRRDPLRLQLRLPPPLRRVMGVSLFPLSPSLPCS